MEMILKKDPPSMMPVPVALFDEVLTRFNENHAAVRSVVGHDPKTCRDCKLIGKMNRRFRPGKGFRC